MRTASNQYRARKCQHWPRVAMWVACLTMGALAPIDRARAAAPATGPAVEAQRRVMDRVQRVLVHVAGSHSDSSNPVWVVAFDPKPSQPPSTRVLMREQFGDPKWRGLSRIAARPLGITSHKGELVLFLALGDEPSRRAWAWFSPSSDGRAERFTYGPKLPSEATILTLAGDANNLWALGRSEPGAATTAPSRRDATTLPSTRRAGESAGLLYLLNGSEWIPQPAPLPEPVTSDLRGVSMAVIDSRPVVALAS